MHHTARQAADGIPPLGLKRGFLRRRRVIARLKPARLNSALRSGALRNTAWLDTALMKYEQRVVGLSGATGLAPGGPLDVGSPAARAWSFDVDAVPLGSEGVEQEQLGFVAILRANPFAHAQPAPGGPT